MVNQYKSSCKCLVIDKHIENYYYGIVPKNKFQSSVIGPRDIQCRSCIPSLSKENKKLPRPYLHWRLGYGDESSSVPLSHNLPSLSLLERPGGFTITGPVTPQDPCNVSSKGSLFIVNPFENASAAAHFTYHIEKCKDESGMEITKTFCKPYTITSESRNYKLIKDSESKLIKVGASTYDEYLQKTGRKFVDRNYKGFGQDGSNGDCKPGEHHEDKVCDNPYYVCKPNNPQFAVQGAVSGSSRTARLKRNRVSNYGDNYQSKFFKNPNRAIKKRRKENIKKCEIGWRHGNKTKCFKTPNNGGGGDHKRRLKPARNIHEYVIEITEEECEFKFVKIFNDCCVDDKGKKKPNEEVTDPSKCGGDQKCKVTTRCKIIKDYSRITINNALTRVRRRHNKKCFNCTRKVECKVLKVVPEFYPPLVGPPLIDIFEPPINGLPNISIFNPPLHCAPNLIRDCKPPLQYPPTLLEELKPPINSLPEVSVFNPPLNRYPEVSVFEPPINSLPEVSIFNPPLNRYPEVSTFNPPLNRYLEVSTFNPSLDCTPNLENLPCKPEYETSESCDHTDTNTTINNNNNTVLMNKINIRKEDLVYINIKGQNKR